MLVLGDRLDYAAELLPQRAAQRLSSSSVSDPLARSLATEFLDPGETCSADVPEGRWRYLLLSAFSPRSQYDRMIELARRRRDLPDRLVCVAGAGDGFHGFKGRSWAAAPGNLHLTVHLRPERAVERFDTAFTVLGTVSVVEAVDGVAGLEGRARVKWTNDVLLEGAKVAGVLAYTQTQEDRVTAAVLGIGLNVETAPDVPRTPSVPAVGAVRDFAPDPLAASRKALLDGLLAALDRNYDRLLAGRYDELLERYRERSAVLGRRVRVVEEAPHPHASVVARGRVVALGPGLELVLDGRDAPITKGRVVLEDPDDRVHRIESGAELVPRADSARR